MGKDNSVEPHHPSNGVVREDYLQKGLPRCSQNYRLAKNYCNRNVIRILKVTHKADLLIYIHYTPHFYIVSKIENFLLKIGIFSKNAI